MASVEIDPGGPDLHPDPEWFSEAAAEWAEAVAG